MKSTSIKLITLSALFVATAVHAQIPVTGDTHPAKTIEQAQAMYEKAFGSGTEYAATLAAAELLKTLYDVPAEKIAAKVVQSQGKSATVKATMPARECDLSLMKNADANKYGWVVQTHSCRGL